MTTNKAWRLRCLGTPSLVADRADGIGIALARKDAALLAYVCMNPGAPSARAAALLWPDATASGAMNNLRQRLHRLRKATGARLLEVADVAHPAPDLRIDLAPTPAALQADPNAWDGDLLQGVELDASTEFAGWLAAERKAWTERRRDALASVASACEESGELARALVLAQRLLADDLLSEHAHRRLMRLHYLRGDIAAAVAAFEACEQVLKDELGLKPSAETQALLATIERGTLPAPVPGRADAPVAASLLRPPATIGRSGERGQLQAAQRAGEIAVLVGEAGIGKTRLLQDFLAEQPAGAAVLVQARPGDLAVPYAALARLLRAVAAAAPLAVAAAPRGELVRVAPGIDGALPGSAGAGAGHPARLQSAIEQFLAAAQGQGLSTLLCDDLHFADRASVEMLRALVDADSLAGFGWVFAHRPPAADAAAAADPDAGLLRMLADAPRARWIAVGPLADAALAEFVDSLALPGVDAAALVPQLARHTGGNPLYALETLRALQARPGEGGAPLLPRPQSVERLLDRRLARLSAPALALARVAAVAAPDFSIGLAEHALATPAMALADAWRELELAGVLRGEGFAHDLVHDAMLRATPAPIARHTHKLVAQFLLREDGADPARLARHWLAAGEHAAAGAAACQAAQRALQAGRLREQGEWLHFAMRAFHAAGDRGAALAVGAQAVTASVFAEGPQAAVALADELLADVPEVRDAVPLWIERATALQVVGDLPASEVSARRALALAGPDDGAWRVGATRVLARAAGMRGEAEAGLALLRPLAEQADAIADDHARIELLNDFTTALMQADRLSEALPVAEKMLVLATATGQRTEAVSVAMNLSAIRLRRGEQEHALVYAEQAQCLMSDLGSSDFMVTWNGAQRGAMLGSVGRYGEGLALLEASVAALAERADTGPLRSAAEVLAAHLLLHLGRMAAAYRVVRDDPVGLPRRSEVSRLYARSVVERALLHSDEPLLRRAQALCDDRGAVYERILISLALLRHDETDPRRCAAACAALQQEAAEREYFGLAAAAGAQRLGHLVAAGQGEGLSRLVETVEAVVHAHRPLTHYFPALLEACATAWAAAGSAADAARCRADAVGWIQGVALPNVPPAFRDSFLHRNEVNRRLLTAGGR